MPIIRIEKIDARVRAAQLAPFIPLKALAQKTGFTRKEIYTAMTHKTGMPFSVWQREQRLDFIKKHQKLSTEELRQKIGVSRTTFMLLIRELKKRGVPLKSRTKVSHETAQPLTRHPMSLNVMRAIRWIGTENGISYQNIMHFFQCSLMHTKETLNLLRQQKLIEQVRIQTPKRITENRLGRKRVFVRRVPSLRFFITKKGREWLNSMENERIERDQRLMMGERGQSVLNRKEKELQYLERIMVYAKQQRMITEEETLRAALQKRRKEIEELRLTLYKAKKQSAPNNGVPI